MKHWLTFILVFAIAAGALVFAQRRRPKASVSPEPLLYLVGDTQRELSRLPVAATRLSDEEEISIGKRIMKRTGFVEVSDKSPADVIAVSNYVNDVGRKLAANAHRKLPYSFHYIPERYFANAFALPGGPVYIGAGLMATMDSEDQLAAVLAHEIEHIDRGHAAERAQLEARMRHLGPLRAAVLLPVAIFQAGYSKQQELEADSEGVRIAVQASYSPEGAVRLLEAFARYDRETEPRKAQTPQQELAGVMRGAMQEYFASHPPSAQRAMKIHELMAAEGWSPRAERDLRVAYIFWHGRATELAAMGKYDQARQLEQRALQVKPDYVDALRGLAEAEFASADFTAAAATYGKLLDKVTPNQDSDVHHYAQALAAADRRSAARAFRSRLRGRPTSPLAGAELSGLELLAGNPQPAQQSELAAARDPNTDPQLTATLGRWHYLAGDYERAQQLLATAAQQRPADAEINADSAWAAVELRRYADAITTFGNNSGQNLAARMGLAVARWQSRQPDAALQDFVAAVQSDSRWDNARWVAALYSPTVAKSITEMKAERERRLQDEERQRRLARGALSR